MSTQELDASLRIILDSLPDDHDGPFRRKHALTKSDAVTIAEMIRVAVANQGCSIGLTATQIEGLKDLDISAVGDMVQERKKLLNALGALTLTALAGLGSILFTNIDWHRVGQFLGIK